MIIPASQIVPVNSTSYVDMLGVLVGMDRLPGEDSATFQERLELAVASDRGPEYIGLLDSISTAFGIEAFQAIQISREDGAWFDLQVLFGTMILGWDGAATSLPLVSITEDNFWSWIKLSDVVAALNQTPGFTASLLGADGSALQLASQTNGGVVVNEDLSGVGRSVRLAHSGLIEESVVFNQDVPDYQLAPDSRTIHFTGQPPSNLAVTYRYRLCPYSLVGSPVSLFSLTDPALVANTRGSNGATVYQVRQYIQEIMQRDRSYWGN